VSKEPGAVHKRSEQFEKPSVTKAITAETILLAVEAKNKRKHYLETAKQCLQVIPVNKRTRAANYKLEIVELRLSQIWKDERILDERLEELGKDRLDAVLSHVSRGEFEMATEKAKEYCAFRDIYCFEYTEAIGDYAQLTRTLKNNASISFLLAYGKLKQSSFGSRLLSEVLDSRLLNINLRLGERMLEEYQLKISSSDVETLFVLDLVRARALGGSSAPSRYVSEELSRKHLWHIAFASSDNQKISSLTTKVANLLHQYTGELGISVHTDPFELGQYFGPLPPAEIYKENGIGHLIKLTIASWNIDAVSEEHTETKVHTESSGLGEQIMAFSTLGIIGDMDRQRKETIVRTTWKTEGTIGVVFRLFDMTGSHPIVSHSEAFNSTESETGNVKGLVEEKCVSGVVGKVLSAILDHRRSDVRQYESHAAYAFNSGNCNEALEFGVKLYVIDPDTNEQWIEKGIKCLVGTIEGRTVSH